jgi:prepilin-type N-terminal cleavage/methylation domain-containing protein
MRHDRDRTAPRSWMAAGREQRPGQAMTSAAGHRRVGFTLVELLVVIAVIGVLASMLLPAVQAAREAGRRLQCMNNLSQLIIAVHNYEMAHDVLPAGTLEPKGPILHAPLGYHHNWIARILPYLDQFNTYRNINFQVGVYDPPNRAVRELTLPLLQCPSGNLARGMGQSNYAGVHHHQEAAIDVNNTGVFFLNSRLRSSDVNDGLSTTLFIGEMNPESKDLALGLTWMSGTRATLRNTGTSLPLRAGGGATLVTPSMPAAPPTNSAGLPVGGFSSFHVNGSLFAFGDGHVQLLNAGIALTVYQQLAHRADGQLLDTSTF